MKFIVVSLLLVTADFAVATNENSSQSDYEKLKAVINELASALDALTSSRQNLIESLRATSNCGSTGSSDELNNIADAHWENAEAFDNLTLALGYATDSEGQFTGDVDPVCDSFKKVTNIILSLSKAVSELTANIDSAGNQDNRPINNVSSSLRDVTESLVFNLFRSIKLIYGPKELFGAISQSLENFNQSIEKSISNLSKLIDAVNYIENRCENQSDTPYAIESVQERLKELLGLIKTKLQQ